MGLGKWGEMSGRWVVRLRMGKGEEERHQEGERMELGGEDSVRKREEDKEKR